MACEALVSARQSVGDKGAVAAFRPFDHTVRSAHTPGARARTPALPPGSRRPPCPHHAGTGVGAEDGVPPTASGARGPRWRAAAARAAVAAEVAGEEGGGGEAAGEVHRRRDREGQPEAPAAGVGRAG